MSQPELLNVAKAWCQQNGFSLEGRAGHGTYKETFRVRDREGQLIALKVYKVDPANERSRREIEAMQRCNHPNISGVGSVGTYEHAGRSFGYVTETFIEGGTLTERMASSLLGRAEVLALGGRLISALLHLKDLALVHRDIKPDNIMLRDGKAETPILVDLGIVRDLNAASLTQTHFQMGPGTPLYSSPEQLTNQKEMIGWQSDQFSLGIVLTVCHLGIHPFDTTESNWQKLLSEQRQQQFSDIVSRISGRGDIVPKAEYGLLEARLPVVLKLLKPWPIHRFNSGQSLADQWAEQPGVD